MSIRRTVCDVQQEIYDYLPVDGVGLIKEYIHNREWDKAEELLTDKMALTHTRLQRLKKVRKIVKRIKR